MIHRRIEPEELRIMLRVDRMTYAEIAEKVGLTISGVKQAARRYGLTEGSQPHKWAVPWTVKEGHNQGKEAKYLRVLSNASRGKVVLDVTNTALNWANELVDDLQDIDYDRERGFYTKPADPANWHLKKVLDRAKVGILRRNR